MQRSKEHLRAAWCLHYWPILPLHGMEEAIGVKYDYRGQLIGKRAVVRYADDFVCFVKPRKTPSRCKAS